ncbi:hypothetical protein [Amycolatopsis sulphurea]|uniref:hypothetical protein n=1 Tax=Amycolatopsis sulphurea TaxID=76022 RepID=UPI003693ACAB
MQEWWAKNCLPGAGHRRGDPLGRGVRRAGTLALQLALPDEMVLRPWWLLPALTTLLTVAVLISGGVGYWTNIFSLWYWEFDRGGPGRRDAGCGSGRRRE